MTTTKDILEGHGIDVEGLRIVLFAEICYASCIDTEATALVGSAERIILEVPQTVIIHVPSIPGAEPVIL